ncbi:GtrA family protein [Chitinasiproducens palmae]|nr:GtrA family protein [Chitinasiproducens palmae]
MLRFLRYAALGAVGTAVQYVLLICLVHSMGVGPVAASSAGAVAGAVTNYLLNHRYSFGGTARHRAAAPRFMLVAAGGLAINAMVMALLTGAFALPYLLAQCVATAAVLALTYVANASWSFKT